MWQFINTFSAFQYIVCIRTAYKTDRTGPRFGATLGATVVRDRGVLSELPTPSFEYAFHCMMCMGRVQNYDLALQLRATELH